MKSSFVNKFSTTCLRRSCFPGRLPFTCLRSVASASSSIYGADTGNGNGSLISDHKTRNRTVVNGAKISLSKRGFPVPRKPRRHSRGHRLTEHSIIRPDKAHVNQISDEAFECLGIATLDKIYDGIKHLPEINEKGHIAVQYSADAASVNGRDISITVEEYGSFQITCVASRRQLHVFSPVSGAVYHYIPTVAGSALTLLSAASISEKALADLVSTTWQCTLDSHNVFEMLARDLVKTCQGYPLF